MDISINNKTTSIPLVGLGTPLLLVMILAMMTLPMPPFILDMLFSFNITLALIVIMVTVYTLRPLHFAAFPTVLLIATLLRLALNVGSTRVVLLNGHNGPGAAGSVIESFGAVVVGGNYAVGLVVFAILVIINFVVVTKGAGRISEVSARFTLDAMPGKQMAIDADLNAGRNVRSSVPARDRSTMSLTWKSLNFSFDQSTALVVAEDAATFTRSGTEPSTTPAIRETFGAS